MNSAHKGAQSVHDVSIYKDERLALAASGWPRWVDQQINTDMRCPGIALHHIRHNRTRSLIERDGEQLKVR